MRDALGRVGKVAVVGGTSDIGLAIAVRLAESGMDRLLLAGRDKHTLEEAAATVGTKATVSLVDVAEVSTHRDAVARLFADGDIDVAIFAAGLLVTDPDPDDAAAMGQVNYVGTVSMMMRVAEAMRQQGHGQIVVMSSAGVTRPRSSNYLYAASKAAVDFAARGLVDELSGSGVAVTIIRPGFVRTKMTRGLSPSPLSSTVEEVANAVAEAVAERRSGVVWIPSSIRVLARALSLLPGPIVRRLDR